MSAAYSELTRRDNISENFSDNFSDKYARFFKIILGIVPNIYQCLFTAKTHSGSSSAVQWV